VNGLYILDLESYEINNVSAKRIELITQILLTCGIVV
jgi:hypothetical protein